MIYHFEVEIFETDRVRYEAISFNYKRGQNQAIAPGAKDNKPKHNGGSIFQNRALFAGFPFKSSWWLESHMAGAGGFRLIVSLHWD